MSASRASIIIIGCYSDGGGIGHCGCIEVLVVVVVDGISLSQFKVRNHVTLFIKVIVKPFLSFNFNNHDHRHSTLRRSKLCMFFFKIELPPPPYHQHNRHEKGGLYTVVWAVDHGRCMYIYFLSVNYLMFSFLLVIYCSTVHHDATGSKGRGRRRGQGPKTHLRLELQVWFFLF